MQVSITTVPHARTMTLTVTETDWEKTQQRSFYHGEQAVQQLVTTIGRALVQELLQNKGAAEPTLEADGQRWYRKAASIGHYLTLYGEVAVERHVSQTSTGGGDSLSIGRGVSPEFCRGHTVAGRSAPLQGQRHDAQRRGTRPTQARAGPEPELHPAHGAAGGPARRAKAAAVGHTEGHVLESL